MPILPCGRSGPRYQNISHTSSGGAFRTDGVLVTLHGRSRLGLRDSVAFMAPGRAAGPMEVADSLLDLVGNTPLVRLRRVGAGLDVRPHRQGRDVQPGRQREGPARDRDDRRGRA